ncbi:MAG: hypothetical protein V2I51_04175, partial [Anderseniella sp.]|nr:hypothetical protein [Anderseniella sp.]
MSAAERSDSVRHEGSGLAGDDAAATAGGQWCAGATPQLPDGHDAAWRPAASPRGSASSAGQPEAMTPEDRIAARRAEIA